MIFTQDTCSRYEYDIFVTVRKKGNKFYDE